MGITLITLLKDLPLSIVDDLGTIILYKDLVNILKARGFDNSELLNYHLGKLKSQGIIELCYGAGCNDQIIGIMLK